MSNKTLIVFGTLLCALLLGVTAVQWRQGELLSRAVLRSGDDAANSIFQAENEYLRLLRVWPRSSHEPSATPDAELRLRFEIFVSRIQLLQSSGGLRELTGSESVAEAVAGAQAFIDLADTLIGPEGSAVDRAVWAGLYDRLAALSESMRSLTVRAGRINEQVHGKRNAAAQWHNSVGIGLSMFLSVLALALAVTVVRQLQRQAKRRVELEQLALELQAARVAAESASAAKSAFLANMSHEIRTPFQGLLGMMSLLQKTGLNEQQKNYLLTATQSADHLLALLNDILDLSRLDSGRMTTNRAPISLHALLAGVEALMQPQAELKGLQLTFELAPRLPDGVLLDAVRVRQVLFNLVANAIKFTDKGHVSLHVRIEPRAQPFDDRDISAECLVIAVKDSGIGMDEETQTRLFSRFSQGDESRSRRYGGAGLGLEISRNLARLMGGDLVASSSPGQGSVFELSLPLHLAAVPAAEPTPEPLATSMRALHILVAEDNDVNRIYMQAVLASLGHSADFAHDGLAAVQAVKTALAHQPKTRPFDLILMDLHMPELDGFEATLRIRECVATSDTPAAVNMPIVALTADVFPETRERCARAGMADFLVKPVLQADLQACIERQVRPD